ETDNIYVEPLIEQVYREIERLQCESISEKELSVVRNYMLGEMCRGYESAFSLSDAWIAVDTAGLGGDYFARSLHAINETSAEELRLMAQKYLCKENLKEAVVGKKLS
ncbi:MAG: insulinase family protein, partial [Bacteroides sp.]|nr:insulinase family protein [Bacteroides sp.]